MCIPTNIWRITINLIIEAVQFLLQHEVSYVLMERFCQSPLENYFGYQRLLGARKDKPFLRDFGFNDNAIGNQKIFWPIAGSVRGGQDQSNIKFSCESIPCQKKGLKRTEYKPEMQTFPALWVVALRTWVLCYKNDNLILKSHVTFIKLFINWLYGGKIRSIRK